MYYIYEIYNLVTQRRYIGLTKNPESRFKAHLVNLRNGKHTAENIIKDYAKYGEESFIFRIIDTANTKEEGSEKEGKYIFRLKTYVPEYGYNGHDSRFFRQRLSLKAPDNELRREIRKKGYLLKDVSHELNLKYSHFIAKLNNMDDFSEEELCTINDFLKITARQRWEKRLWWFQDYDK